jgi:chemotaxis protein methyltransferase CheR
LQSAREFRFTDRDFERIRNLVSLHTGIAMSDAKRDMVYSRLTRRLRNLGLNCFERYCDLVEQGSGDEVTQFVNAVTTNLTAFFREPHHFEFLARTVLPALVRNRVRNRRLRIWSAGCSTGEEPCSIALVLKENAELLRGWDVRILATDIDSNALSTAARGVYPGDRVHGIPNDRLQLGFRRGVGTNSGKVRVASELQDMIRYKQLNLMDRWPMKGPFEVIFCRNVVIYFDKATQRNLFDRFAHTLGDGGYLFVGHSESLFNISSSFELIGKTVYRKRT